MTVCAHGSRAFNRYKAAAPPLPISSMKSLPTRDTLDHMIMTTLIGWPLNYRMEVTLRVLLFIRPAAASKARRDATPLRLISWLSYKLNPELEQFIEKAMEHLSTWTETEGGKVLTMGKEAIPREGQLTLKKSSATS